MPRQIFRPSAISDREPPPFAHCQQMAKFFLNPRTKRTLFEDSEGIELPTLDDARQQTIDPERELLADDILPGRLGVSYAFEICDETGEVLEIVPFQLAYRLN